MEADPYCRKVIEQRAKEGFVPQAPLFEDICCFKMSDLKDQDLDPDGIMGGWPCQASIQAVLALPLLPNHVFLTQPILIPNPSQSLAGHQQSREPGWT